MKNIINELEEKNLENIINEKKWKKNCPKCNRMIYYNRKDSLYLSLKKLSLCRNCSSKGRFVSKETRRKLSKLKLGKVSWRKGKKLSDEHRYKISLYGKGKQSNNFGKKHSKEIRLKMSISAKNRIISNEVKEEQKRKLRIIRCERLKKFNIAGCEDIGANNWFKELNNRGFNYKQNWYCKELGYFADGYDKDTHIWYEFDTPYHKIPHIQDKDLIRQNNIINYFKSIGNPLNDFIRVSADKEGNVLQKIHVKC